MACSVAVASEKLSSDLLHSFFLLSQLTQLAVQVGRRDAPLSIQTTYQVTLARLGIQRLLERGRFYAQSMAFASLVSEYLAKFLENITGLRRTPLTSAQVLSRSCHRCPTGAALGV